MFGDLSILTVRADDATAPAFAQPSTHLPHEASIDKTADGMRALRAQVLRERIKDVLRTSNLRERIKRAEHVLVQRDACRYRRCSPYCSNYRERALDLLDACDVEHGAVDGE